MKTVNDLVEKLRSCTHLFHDPNDCVTNRAADEIERLQRDYAQLLERWKEEQALRIQAQAGGSDDSQGSV